MIEDLIRMYEEGAITDYQLMLDSLHKIDPENPELVLESLPPEVHDSILDYASRYDPRRADPTNRLLPTPDQVKSATSWIQEQRLARSHPSS